MTKRLIRISLGIAAAVAAACLVAVAFAQQPPAGDRIGLAEEFDNLDGWKKIDFPPRETAPLKEMKVENGVAFFETHGGHLEVNAGKNWPDAPKEFYTGASNLLKTYPELDFDKYHYLVTNIPEKGCEICVILNDVDLPLTYTTGVHAVDLRDFGFKGKAPVNLRLQFGCNAHYVKVDYFRFVSSLTPEENRGLIPAGYRLHRENLKENLTNGLDALLRRADRPLEYAPPDEEVSFRDLGTGAVVRRLTGFQTGATIISDQIATPFNANGSHMIVNPTKLGPCLYSFQTGDYRPLALAGMGRFSPRDAKMMWAIEKSAGKVRIHRVNILTGADDCLGEVQYDDKKYYTPITDSGWDDATDKAAIGLRETPWCFIFDPSKPKFDDRIQLIELPMRLKGIGLARDGKAVRFNRCYFYDGYEMDLETKALTTQVSLGGSHAGGGGGMRLAHYQGMILGFPRDFNEPVAADKVKILLNYRSGFETDYGRLTADAGAYCANGSGEGDMNGQVILVNGREAGTALHVAFQNNSRDNWGNNNNTFASPDHTKVFWQSDMLGYNSVYMAETRRPEPPRSVKAVWDGDAVALAWQSPVKTWTRLVASETLGYNIYRSVDGGPFVRLNREVIAGTSWRDDTASPREVTNAYLVVAQEFSGLEGNPSSEALVMPGIVRGLKAVNDTLHIEAETEKLEVPAREVFSGWTSGYRYVRITKEHEKESAGKVTFAVTPNIAGDYAAWLLVRAEDAPGKWQLALDKQPPGEVAVDAKEWTWVKLATPLKLEATRQTLTLTSADEGLCIDKLILTNDAKYAPKTLDDRFATPPGKVRDVTLKEATTSSVCIAWWDPVASPDVAYYSVYVGDRADFPCDQAHILASTTKNELLDWGLEAGKTFVYKVVAVSRGGVASEPASITAKTQPLEKTVLIEMAAQEAKLDPRLKKEEKDGKKYVYLPDQGEAHQKDDPAAVTFDFETPVAGDYMIWCEYAPGDTSTSTMSLPTLLDGFLDGKGVWKIRPPFRVMAGSNYRVWKKDLWFSDKVSIYTWPKAHDLLKLSAGKHQLTIKLPCQAAEFPHKIARVWITNDQWFRPPGWDAQADIRKARTKRE